MLGCMFRDPIRMSCLHIVANNVIATCMTLYLLTLSDALNFGHKGCHTQTNSPVLNLCDCPQPSYKTPER